MDASIIHVVPIILSSQAGREETWVVLKELPIYWRTQLIDCHKAVKDEEVGEIREDTGRYGFRCWMRCCRSSIPATKRVGRLSFTHRTSWIEDTCGMHTSVLLARVSNFYRRDRRARLGRPNSQVCNQKCRDNSSTRCPAPAMTLSAQLISKSI